MNTKNASRRNLSDFKESALPPVYHALRVLAAKVREAALKPMPDLDAEPSNEEQARAMLAKCVAWREEIKSSARELCDWFSGHSLGVASQWTGRDLLGALPNHFDGPGAGASFLHGIDDFLRQTSRNDIDAGGAKPVRDDLVGRWPEAKSDTFAAMLAGRSKVLQLCAWIDDQLDRFLDAALPRITIGKDHKQGTRSMAVTLAGVPYPGCKDSIDSELANTLIKMADCEPLAVAKSLEGVLGKIRTAIPALQGLVKQDKTLYGMAKDRDDYPKGCCVFILDPAMRGRITAKKS